MLRMIRALDTNDELIDSLVEDHVLRTDRVIQAFRALPRASFLTQDVQDTAYVDTPVRINSLGFNVSAPHVYALCMEALEFEPGHMFLDVGSGCGLFTAIAAQLVSPAGECVGLDLRQDIIDFAQNNIRNLRQTLASSTHAATPAHGSGHNDDDTNDDNESLEDRDGYDQDNTNSDRSAAAAASSSISTDPQARMRTQMPAFDNIHFIVRNVFLPADPDETIREFDRIHVGAACPPDSLPQLCSLLKPRGILVTPSGTELLKITKDDKGQIKQTAISQVRYGDLVLPTEAEILIARKRIAEKFGNRITIPADDYRSDFEHLIGNPMMSDITFVAQGHSIPAHKVILAARSEFFRAMFTSGFQEANGSCRYDVDKDEISLGILRLVLRYIYLGEVPSLTTMSGETMVDLLHASSRWQLARLKALCETELRKSLTLDNAASLLTIADEHAAHQLKSAVLEFIVKNFEGVKSTATFQDLDRSLFMEITALACARLNSF